MKIISDGTREGTKLYTDSGEEIADVQELYIYGTTDMPYIVARIKLIKPTIEFNIEDNRIELVVVKEEDNG